MTTAVACPSCGTRRVGSFRYCRTCGFDYDTGGRLPEDPTRQPVASAEQRVAAPQPVPAPGSVPTDAPEPLSDERIVATPARSFVVTSAPSDIEGPAPGSLTSELIARIQRVGPAAMERYERTNTITRAAFIISFLVLGAISFVLFIFALVFTGTVDSIAALDRRHLVPRAVQFVLGAMAVVFFAVALSVVLSPA